MELYFLRHGLAADANPDGHDAARPLTKEGVAKIKAAARAMRKLGVQPDALITSPLVRAHETARLVARELNVECQLSEALAPGCELAQLAELLAEHRAAEQVLLVGHEPDFSQMIGELTGGRVQMKKGALARVDLPAIEPGAGALAWLLPPRVLREMA